jgi:predicted dehydrogenase
MQKAHIGVVGCGYWGPNLIRNFVELPNARVLAVADLQAERLDYVAHRFPGVETTRDYRDLFSMPIDGVVVATPPSTHHRIASEFLHNGFHVLVEKPLTLNSADAQSLIELADLDHRILMVGHTFEYNPAVRQLREIIQSGELGEIYYFNSVRANLGLFQQHLNVVWDLAPHDISILLYLIDEDPLSTSATGAACVLEGIHDIAYINLEFPSGIIAHIHVSWLDPCKVRRMTVVGSKKMAVYDDVEPLEKIRIYDKGVNAPPYTDTYADFQFSYRYGDVVIPHIPYTEPLRIECEHFIHCIQSNEKPQSSGHTGLRVVRVVEAAVRSMQNGGEKLSPTSNPAKSIKEHIEA